MGDRRLGNGILAYRLSPIALNKEQLWPLLTC